MLFTERNRARMRIIGLVLMCVGPISACEDDPEPPATHDAGDEGSSSLSERSISSRARNSGSSSSSSSTSSTSSSSTSKTTAKTVASCKSKCDDKGDTCKVACDEDDEDCNQSCDDDRYACRKKCDKTTSTSSSSSSSSDDDEVEKADGGTTTRSSSARDAGTASGSTTSVTIKFAARVGKDDFACGQEYPSIGKSKTNVTPTDLRMFVQDVKLINESGDEVPVELDTRKPWQTKDVALLDFEDGTSDCNAGNTDLNTKITGKVPEDTYVGIIFSNGVPESLNHEDPTAAAGPLGMFTDLSWGWLGGYIFTKLELKEVTTSSTFGTGIAHVGSTACTGKPESGTVKCGKPNRNLVQLDDFDPKTNTIVFDVSRVFEQTDLTQMSECHSTGEFCTPMFEALGVDLTTGKALDKQSVFSVM